MKIGFERYLWSCFDVFQPRKPFGRDSLGFQVYRRIKDFVVVDETDGHDMWPIFHIQGCKPGHPGLLQFYPDGPGNPLRLARHVGTRFDQEILIRKSGLTNNLTPQSQ